MALDLMLKAGSHGVAVLEGIGTIKIVKRTLGVLERDEGDCGNRGGAKGRGVVTSELEV